ncbi:hypothetical protein K2173_021848 [Erythroxylum novogranatense]|uniref:RRM domain-containing protein n=1 Tax=Erythroxylum novogranatense TaxID=1862640 RepID=A0AAV8T208_9ROSI|nr:hypothetical protein K2173_021848 [Erythroxylum novogranatense]
MGGQVVFKTNCTKIFVGGLAWETRRDALELYFQQFGEIMEAVVIVDRITRRSKGYGFVIIELNYLPAILYITRISIFMYILQVIFKNSDAATKACQNPHPVIDGRRTNCNLAAAGKNQLASWPFFPRPMLQNSFPGVVYGYPASPQDLYATKYDYANGRQPFMMYYAIPFSFPAGLYSNYEPFSQQYCYRFGRAPVITTNIAIAGARQEQ